MKLKLHAMAALVLSIAGSCALVQSVQAQFTYQSRDLMLVFRKTGNDGSGTVGSVDVQVDIGQASMYYGAALGSSIPITNYSATTQLGLFDNLDDLSWSVGGCVPNTGDSGDPAKPIATLWVTEPRMDPNTQASPPWQRTSSFQQGLAAAKISSIINDAGIWAGAVHSDSVTNSSNAVVIPSGNPDNANGSLGASGNYAGNFHGGGVVENTTPPDFIYGSSPSRSDLYELQPGSGSGTYLGYFELALDGTMTFYAPSATVTYPAPTLSVSQSAGSVTISFQSTSGGTYSLYSTSAANMTAPVSSWTFVTSLTGDGGVDQFPQQTISGTGTIYAVTVH